MDAEPSIAALARQQRLHHGTVEDRAGVDGLLTEQVPPGQQADSRFRRCQQPADRGTCTVVDRSHPTIM
jgi:hypothetical protein